MKLIRRSYGSGNGTFTGFTVEARVRDIEGLPQNPVRLVDGTLLGHEWKQLHFEEGNNPAGVPGKSSIDPGFNRGLLPWQSAIALAWTVVAQNLTKTIECQIVKHKLTYSYSVERQGVIDGLAISDVNLGYSMNIIDDVSAQSLSGTHEASK